jgi:probable 2-oxoglutarate dehydrogenase E1 component DHKTD1
MHSPSKTERLWFSHLLESETLPSLGGDNPGPLSAMDKETKLRIHGQLARSEVLDNFLQLKFPNLKRASSPMFLPRSDIYIYLAVASMGWKVGNL